MQELHGEIFVYNMLARIFYSEPTLELLHELAGLKLPSDTEADASKGMLHMVEVARLHSNNLEELQDELAIEFTRLFLGPIKPVAIPYASWYLSESHQLMTDETIDVRRRYLEAGMAVNNLYSTPDDHISIELEFLSYLTGEMITAHEAGQQERLQTLETTRDGFINDHMKQWVHVFIATITDSDANKFYKGAALLLDEVLLIS
ncbi:MAG: molecular chaperone TorD family protein [Geobacteraceae bacterium]|nr:molecular chaperone TorD family protein [Geobacteraceae bacterium]